MDGYGRDWEIFGWQAGPLRYNKRDACATHAATSLGVSERTLLQRADAELRVFIFAPLICAQGAESEEEMADIHARMSANTSKQ